MDILIGLNILSKDKFEGFIFFRLAVGRHYTTLPFLEICLSKRRVTLLIAGWLIFSKNKTVTHFMARQEHTERSIMTENPITANLLRLLEQETTSFILAILPHLNKLPKKEFEKLLSTLTSAREHLGTIYGKTQNPE